MCFPHFLSQLNEALCASSPDLVSPCVYQSPVDSTSNLNLIVPSMPLRRLSLGVSLPFSLLLHFIDIYNVIACNDRINITWADCMCFKWFEMLFLLFCLNGTGGGVQHGTIQHGGCTAPVAVRKGPNAGYHKEAEGWDGGGQTVAGERGEVSGMNENNFNI